ncbi:hypothetical protein JOY44_10275 [Phormidium sp. CLA17]|uniref:hypothetical protein n=1 Tax=Leptolyngbya sp. Cla-17 TaxID=2803751 RepID=UPI001491DE40|nr:hypothetical protein [Leptolyngbya sp. Cla-17]MBM0742006.1 hypothetical protein [Leptolyngbya sp. Cla-17]
MFQDASTNPVSPNSSDAAADAKETGGFSSNSYVDRLMDDLFEDVEQLLHGESQRTDHSALSLSQPADLSPKPEVAPALAMPPFEAAIAPPEELSSSSALAMLDSLSVSPTGEQTAMVPETASITASAVALPHDHRPPGSVYDRLLLAVGCVAVVVSLALWLLYQESRRPQVVTSVPTAGTAVTPESAPQNQFSDYAQKALQSIDQRSQQGGSTATASAATAGAATSGTPTVTIQKPITPTSLTPDRATTGLGRVYVPVYQFPSNFKPPNSVTPLPGVAPSAASQYNAPVRKPVATAASPITPGVPRRLAGVLELGDRSVALFEINGVTQRYGIGESIGSSGWSLVEVSKEQAMIRRNGEVRSVFVGQNF